MTKKLVDKCVALWYTTTKDLVRMKGKAMKKDSKTKKLTELEAVIMEAVWNLEQGSVRDVQEYLRNTRPMARNTVLTMMGILRDKGFLVSTREGRADIYRPKISRDQMSRHSLNDILTRFFDGSAFALVSQLLDSEKVEADEIKAIRKEVNRRLKEDAE